jgi:hypothetical protein
MTALAVFGLVQSAALAAYVIRLRARVSRQDAAVMDWALDHAREIAAYKAELATADREVCRLMEANEALTERLRGRAS